MIPREIIEEIINRTDISDLIGSYVTLKRAGSNMNGLCPFHSEKSPSFTVYPADNSFYCFGCGVGGDVFSFVRLIENLDYIDAVKLLAERSGVTIPQDGYDDSMQRLKNTIFEINRDTARFYHSYLMSPDGKWALDYLTGRGLSISTIKRFGLGFCPSSGHRFSDDARGAGYKEEFLLSTGLAIARESDGALRDRFYDRVIFPIHNISGRVVGFGGRTLRTDKKVAKYQNSPESEIYNKRRELYGLFFAKKAIQQEDMTILVEGYADVISMHQAGVENVVASSGTSLTEDQIRLISRFTNNITLMFDGDAAGVKAALRGVDLILKEGMNVKIVLLPEEHDPDTFARAHDSETLKAYIKDNAQDFLAFKAKLLLGEATSDPLMRTNAINDMVQSIALISNEIKRAEYVRYCAEIMNVDQQTLAVAVTRQLDGVKGNIEAQNFLLRQQQRERNQYPASSMQVARPESNDAKVTPSIEGGTTPETLERELTKYLLKYGHCNFDVLNDRDVVTFNVARFIFDELECDGLQFDIDVYRSIVAIYRAEWERLGDGVEVSTDIFINNPDINVSSVSIDLLTSDDNYVISKIWEQKEVHIESAEEQLSEGVPKAMMVYKWRTLDKRIKELRANLATADEESLGAMMSLLSKYQAARVTIARAMGRLI